jgi:hypothetical protein
MKTAAEFQQYLIERGACERSREWADGKTLSEAWEQCENPVWLYWLAKNIAFENPDPMNIKLLQKMLDIIYKTDLHLICDQLRIVFKPTFYENRNRI